MKKKCFQSIQDSQRSAFVSRWPDSRALPIPNRNTRRCRLKRDPVCYTECCCRRPSVVQSRLFDISRRCSLGRKIHLIGKDAAQRRNCQALPKRRLVTRPRLWFFRSRWICRDWNCLDGIRCCRPRAEERNQIWNSEEWGRFAMCSLYPSISQSR